MNNDPQRGYLLIPRICEYDTFHGRGDFAGGMKLRIVKWGDYSGLSWWPSVIRRVLLRGTQDGQRQKERLEDAMLLALEGGATSQGMQAASGNWKGQGILS